MHPKYLKKCRICGSPHLTSVVDLGEQFLQGSFVKEGVVRPPYRKLPTHLVRCDVTRCDEACGLVQLAHTFPQEVLYANYWYRSGTNTTMRNHLRQVAETALALVGPRARDLHVLDIGCNDGTLLGFYPESSARFGIDPSDIAREIAPPIKVVNTVFPSERASAALAGVSFDIVTSIAMFYDLDDPVAFARGIAEKLAESGIWILEMSYLPLMLLQNSFDTICHEHLEYYTLATIEFILGKVGLRAFRVELNEINGGSFRVYACHAGNLDYGTAEEEDMLRRVRLHEFELALDTDAPYRDFDTRIRRLREETRNLLHRLRMDGKRIHVYGASTKGNVLLQWYGIDRVLVEAAADRNPQKVGARTVGTDIPIISEESSRAAQPDYYLVLPWHFKREFLERERATILQGTSMIFPLPELLVVTAANLEAVIAALAAESDSLEQRFFAYGVA